MKQQVSIGTFTGRKYQTSAHRNVLLHQGNGLGIPVAPYQLIRGTSTVTSQFTPFLTLFSAFSTTTL